MSSTVTDRSSGDMPAIGSSSSTSSGFRARATAMSSRFWSPWGSDPARVSARSARATIDSSSIDSPTSRPWDRARRIRRVVRPSRARTATSTFSRAVRSLKMLVIWNALPIPRRAMSAGWSPSIRSPLYSTSPAVGDELPRDQVEQGGLPRPVGADDGAELPLPDGEAHVVGDLQAPERLRRGGGPQGWAVAFPSLSLLPFRCVHW